MVSLRQEAKREIDASGFHEHNLLIYPDVDTFREIYCMYAKVHLQPEYNEIVLIASQYEPIDKVRSNLSDYGIDVDRYEKDGSLIIIDSVKGYQSDKDHSGVMNLCKLLVTKTEKDGKMGVCAFGDIGSFFMYERAMDIPQYELSIPTKPAIKLKSFCSYHAGDYANLPEDQKKTIAANHFRRLILQN